MEGEGTRHEVSTDEAAAMHYSERLQDAATAELNAYITEHGPNMILGPARRELGAYMLLYQDVAQLATRRSGKQSYMPTAQLTSMLAECGIVLQPLTYERATHVVVVCLLCGLGPMGEEVYHHVFVYRVIADPPRTFTAAEAVARTQAMAAAASRGSIPVAFGGFPPAGTANSRPEGSEAQPPPPPKGAPRKRARSPAEDI